uniref:Uncharacterized protein n=1 Tax=Rhipicephalus appendiculatus TaxID=34631 RepID=A0A131YBD6_RHIAP
MDSQKLCCSRFMRQQTPIVRSFDDYLEKCCLASLNCTLSRRYKFQNRAVSPFISLTLLLSFVLQVQAQLLPFHGDHPLPVLVAPAGTTRLGPMSEIYAQYFFYPHKMMGFRNDPRGAICIAWCSKV